MFAAFGATVQCKQVVVSSSSLLMTAIVEYIDPAHAKIAAVAMDSFDLAGAKLQCQLIPADNARRMLSPIASTPAAGGTATSSTSGVSSIVPASPSSSSSSVVLLENMISIEAALEDPTLKDEIAEEAATHGKLNNVELLIDTERKEVKVKLYYQDAIGASTAAKALNGKRFDGNTIKAVLVA